MCGIGFYVSNKYQIPLSLAVNLLLKQLERGTQGVGIAWRNDDYIVILKKPVHPQTFRYMNSIRQLLENTYSNAIIVHNRQPSQGSFSFVNTHPFYGCIRGKQALCHNGHFSNHKALRKFLQLKNHRFEGDTDTEVLIHVWEELLSFKKFSKILNEFSPGVVLLLTPQFLFIWRDHNPVCIYISKDRSTIIGGSTKRSANYLKKQLEKQGIKFDNDPLTIEEGNYIVINLDSMKIINEEVLTEFVEPVFTWGYSYYRECPYKRNYDICPVKNYAKCKYYDTNCPYKLIKKKRKTKQKCPYSMYPEMCPFDPSWCGYNQNQNCPKEEVELFE